eukprot:TRINITY_DN6927_c0_g1_i1.p1 TRINITY_DN6927_c0_g1~~TRINITY_DN6927_c0_g1_i1.p1  ORF type:complete len:825 (+),score=165.68 TRINITY_DN6927_c0_g1_i1:196-2670(+)
MRTVAAPAFVPGLGPASALPAQVMPRASAAAPIAAQTAVQPSSQGEDQASRLEHFLRRGYLLVPPAEGDASLHAAIAAKAAAIHASGPEATWRLADGVLAAVPELQVVLDRPAPRRALTSVLGRGYLLHAHRHLHYSSEADQMWHKDSYWGNRKSRHHRPRWCMMLYYPQDTTLNMGPTHVLAGSQYWTLDHEEILGESGEDILIPDDGTRSMFAHGTCLEEKQAKLSQAVENFVPGSNTSLVEDVILDVPAGSCVLMHYDLFHRASGRLSHSAPERFMVKFQFLRTAEPTPDLEQSALWPNSRTASSPSNAAPREVEPILRDVRSWLGGEDGSCRGGHFEHGILQGTRAEQVDVLLSPESSEVQRLAAAYRLGQSAEWQLLLKGFLAPEERIARASTYGLCAAGSRIAPAIVPQLRHACRRVRRLAAFALGEAALPTASLLSAFGEALRHESHLPVVEELLEALAYIASRARSHGERDLCDGCVSLALPFLVSPSSTQCRSVRGQNAALVVLMASDARGDVAEEALAPLAIVLASADNYAAGFAAEIFRRRAAAQLLSTLGRPSAAVLPARRALGAVRATAPAPTAAAGASARLVCSVSAKAGTATTASLTATVAAKGVYVGRVDASCALGSLTLCRVGLAPAAPLPPSAPPLAAAPALPMAVVPAPPLRAPSLPLAPALSAAGAASRSAGVAPRAMCVVGPAAAASPCARGFGYVGHAPLLGRSPYPSRSTPLGARLLRPQRLAARRMHVLQSVPDEVEVVADLAPDADSLAAELRWEEIALASADWASTKQAPSALGTATPGSSLSLPSFGSMSTWPAAAF